MAEKKIDHYNMHNKFKVVFLGDIEVGKTAIINNFIHGRFDHTHSPTIGIDFLSKTMVIDDRVLRFQLWDTAGQEKFHSLIPTYIKDASAAVLVFDITSRGSFLHIDRWYEEVVSKRGTDLVIVLIANKIDLDE
jgi:Ras-related protein Rab-6A